jgi:hypothetical protein
MRLRQSELLERVFLQEQAIAFKSEDFLTGLPRQNTSAGPRCRVPIGLLR